MSRTPSRTRTGTLIMVAGCLALATTLAIALWPVTGSHAAAAPAATLTPVDVFPIPGDQVASSDTQIVFRGVPVSELGAITVTGSVSGVHAGQVRADSDGLGGSFLPAAPFKAGETVTVSTDLDIVGGRAGSFSFTIAIPAGRILRARPNTGPVPQGTTLSFSSRPDLRPPAVRVIKSSSRVAAGDLFVTPQRGPAQEGPMILSPNGHLIWFDPVPTGETATDFRPQTYEGQPVLTWWQGGISATGIGQGKGEIYDSSYLPIATVKAGNGLGSDLHEFQLTAQNTALITVYYPVIWNASSVKGGSKRSVVYDSIVQEIDIPTGLVLYQWDSLDHVPLTDSHQPYPTAPHAPYDYFHINSVQEAADGSLIVSARNTWAVYDISHQTGAIIWTLNGKHSSFKMGPGTTFAFQHDARLQGANEVTMFDDGGGPPAVHKQSRGLTLRLDTKHMTATLVAQYEHSPALLAEFEGGMQPQPNGDELIGWGQQPYITEFNARGQTVFEARFVGRNLTYRAYRFPWSGTPANLPAVTGQVSGGRTTVDVSWNGATGVAQWVILAGTSADSLDGVKRYDSSTFESAIRIRSGERYVAAQALDAQGHVLATSPTVSIP